MILNTRFESLLNFHFYNPNSYAERFREHSPLSIQQISQKDGSGKITAQTFSFRELAAAAKNFRAECLLGEGGFGRVYKGHLERTNQVSQCSTNTHIV